MQVAKFLSVAREDETFLGDSYLMVANRHEKNADVRDGCKRFAEWTKKRLEAVKPFVEQYGSRSGEDPERLRSALFHGARTGGPGLIRDLQDLAVLVEHTHWNWFSLQMAAHSLHDQALEEFCKEAVEQSSRQRAWLRTHLEHSSAQALTVDAEPDQKLKASMPKTPTPAATPEVAWAPLASGLLLLVVGLIGLALGRPILLPSLGPTAVLQAEMPAHPSSRAYNVVVGHIGGIIAGFIAVLLVGAMNAPAVLTSKELVAARAWAAVIAIALTVLVGLITHSSHPPAAATTLLVALGSIKNVADVLNLMIGVVVITIAGEAVRYARLKAAVPRSG